MSPAPESSSQLAMAVVDPVSTGATVALEAYQRGYAVFAVWTRELTPDLRAHTPLAVMGNMSYVAEVEEADSVAETAALLKSAAAGYDLVAVMCGTESGVKTSDALSEHLGLRTNGAKQSCARRNKKQQQDCVKAAGLRSVREALGTKWSEVEPFVRAQEMPVIVKPVESAGSDGVKLCQTLEEARDHFTRLVGEARRFGAQNAGVLVQEFLRGTEYVVDHVSRDGVHKTTMVWVYDKRPANGAPFVYFGMQPVRDPELVDVLVPYTRGVLDALGMKNGPSHGEIMLRDDGPVLVEMNARSHGGDGNWVPLARALTGGYSQVDVTLDAYERSPARFDRIPDRFELPFKASGEEVLLVSAQAGEVVATPGFDRIRTMSAFVSLETHVHPGCTLEPTVDVFSQAGSVILCHPNDQVVREDLATIRRMEKERRMFVLKEHASFLSPPPSVVRGRSRSGSSGELRKIYRGARAITEGNLHRGRYPTLDPEAMRARLRDMLHDTPGKDSAKGTAGSDGGFSGKSTLDSLLEASGLLARAPTAVLAGVAAVSFVLGITIGRASR